MEDFQIEGGGMCSIMKEWQSRSSKRDRTVLGVAIVQSSQDTKGIMITSLRTRDINPASPTATQTPKSK